MIRLNSLLILVVCAFCVVGQMWQTNADDVAVNDDFLLERARQYETNIRDLTAQLAPSVICVQAMPDATSLNPNRRFGGGGGSGVIIDEAGYALSNFHVTEYGPIMVGMVDGRLHPAKVVAYDESADIVLIKIDRAGRFDAVPLGDSDAVQVGDACVAMGNPFGLAVDYKPTTTFGILSGTGRYLEGRGFGHELIYTGILQTDTPINPGNSGGPLFNKTGQLLGINGRIALAGGRRVNVGVGYTIPINMIQRFLGAMRSGVNADHGILGISFTEGTRPKVIAVIAESPAAKMGIKVGDRITHVNGEEVRDAYHLVHEIGGYPSGAAIAVGLDRQMSAEETASFKLGGTLAARPMIRRYAKFTSGDRVANVDLVSAGNFVRTGAKQPTILEQVIRKMRRVNEDALRLDGKGSTYVHTLRMVPDANEARFNPRSGGYITADRIECVDGFTRYFSRTANHGVSNEGMQMFARAEDGGWHNGGRGRFVALAEGAVKGIESETRRRLAFWGKQVDDRSILTLEKNERVIRGRTCYVLKETWNAKSVRHHFIDKASGIRVGFDDINSSGAAFSRSRFIQLGRLQGRVIPILTQVRNLNNQLILEERIHSVKWAPELPSFLFTFQPSRHF